MTETDDFHLLICPLHISLNHESLSPEMRKVFFIFKRATPCISQLTSRDEGNFHAN